jgi:hypothetical protein
MKTIVAAAITVTADAACERAQDNTTTNFLNAVHANSISSPEGDAALVRVAHLACQERRAGANGNTLANEMGLRPGWTKSTLCHPPNCSRSMATPNQMAAKNCRFERMGVGHAALQNI